jgi:hypothetical protein
MQVGAFARYLPGRREMPIKRSGFLRNWFGITVLALFLGGLAFYHVGKTAWKRESQPFLSISSPDRTYNITFSGRRDRPTIPFTDHSVYMEITKAGEFVRRSTKFLSGDWLDPSFDMLFPNHQWIGNNTLLLYREQYRQDTALDTVEVINTSDITVSYIGIRSQDCAILLDIKPHSTTTFQISGARSDSKSVFVEGQLTHQTALPSQGAGFDVQNKEPLLLRVTISGSAIAIDGTHVKQ